MYAQPPLLEGEIPPFKWHFDYTPLISSPLHRLQYISEVGGFDERIKRGQENNLHLRLFLSGVKFIFHNTLCFYYRQHRSASRISSQERGLDAYIHLEEIATLLEQFHSGEEIPSSDRALIAERFWSWGRNYLRAGHHELAARCFQRSSQIWPHGVQAGSFQYQLTCKFFGPVWAERFSELKQLLPTRFSLGWMRRGLS